MELKYNAGMPVGHFESSYISDTSFNNMNVEIGYPAPFKLATIMLKRPKSRYQKKN